MKPCGLSSKERLKSPLQFKSACKEKAVKSTLIWLYRVSNGLTFNRLGISVSNRFCANIVKRNKIKKIIRRIFQCNKESFGQGEDIVLVLKQPPDQITYKYFETIILDLSKR
ncbi:MAG: ribonuclease P protein component [Candidatus Omnitrophota bacterium]